MQYVIIGAIIVECIALIILAVLKKLTRLTFVIVSAAVAIACLVIMATLSTGSEGNGSIATTINPSDRLYMSAELLKEGSAEGSIEALSGVNDEEFEEYGIRELKGAALNLNGSYSIAVSYIDGADGPNADSILEASANKKPIEENIRNSIIDKVESSLNLSEDDSKRLLAEMRILYYQYIKGSDGEDAVPPTDNSSDDVFVRASEALNDGNKEEAYRIIALRANDNSLPVDIVLSQMYAFNYNGRDINVEDAEYDRLLEDVTLKQIEMDLAALDKDASSDGKDEPEYGKEVSDEQKKNDTAIAAYEMASTQYTDESVKRAIRYLESSKVPDKEKNTAYLLQMAYLYFLSQQYSLASNSLDSIYLSDDIDPEQWMGPESQLLKEAYLIHDSNPADKCFYDMFLMVYKSLYQGVISDYSDVLYEYFLLDYFKKLTGGIRIGNINAEHFPEISVDLYSYDNEEIINEQSLSILDSGADISRYSISKKSVINPSVCFVLDHSGSMSGDRIKSAKRAIRESIMSMSGMQVALVQFDHTAEILCELTDSKYYITSCLDEIEANGGTEIAKGLLKADEVLQSASGSRIVILLSDGYDGSEDTIDSCLETLAADGITVYAVGLPGCDEEYLQRITDSTGGAFIETENSGKLSGVFDEVQQYLSNGYTLTFMASEESRDNRYLRICVNDKPTSARKEYRKAGSFRYNDALNGRSDSVGSQRSDYFKQLAW